MIKKGDIIYKRNAEFIALNNETESEAAECRCMFTSYKRNSKRIYEIDKRYLFRLSDVYFGTHPDRTAYNRIATSDTINHPPHYGGKSNQYEAIKVIEAWELNFCLGNAVKYISRAGKKTASKTEDLKKAIWYLERELSNEKNV